MEYTRDANGFVMPPTPASSYAPSVAPSEISGSSTGSGRKKLVEDPLYCQNNLAENNIYMRSYLDQFPDHITSLVDQLRKNRDSP